MSKLFMRVTSAFLVFGAVIGLLLSLAMIVLVFPAKAAVTTAVGETLSLSHSALTTTAEVLEVVNDTLGEVDSSFSLLVESTRSTAESLKTTSELTSSIAGLVGSGLSNVITETQDSLKAASKTARVVDDVLAVISAVPLFRTKYAPENTLESTIQGISSSLDPMETTLGDIRTDLNQTAGDLGGIRTSLDDLADSLDKISASIDDAQTAADQYQETVDGLIEKVEFAQKNYRTWLTVAAILVIAFFLWMAAAQVGILMQARAMWTGKPLQLTGFEVKPEKPAEPANENERGASDKSESLPSEPKKEELQS